MRVSPRLVVQKNLQSHIIKNAGSNTRLGTHTDIFQQGLTYWKGRMSRRQPFGDDYQAYGFNEKKRSR